MRFIVFSPNPIVFSPNPCAHIFQCVQDGFEGGFEDGFIGRPWRLRIRTLAHRTSMPIKDLPGGRCGINRRRCGYPDFWLSRPGIAAIDATGAPVDGRAIPITI
jgi:hypothetical protein